MLITPKKKKYPTATPTLVFDHKLGTTAWPSWHTNTITPSFTEHLEHARYYFKCRGYEEKQETKNDNNNPALETLPSGADKQTINKTKK